MDKINLLAFSLPIVFFLYFLLVGYSALSILRTQRNIIQNLLLAPSVGVAFTILPIFWLNYSGLPVIKFAILLTFFLTIISFLILLYKRPLFPLKKYLPFLAIFLLALLFTGRPLFEFGFNWLSFANDDMTNYCLSALRFLYHGYNDTPNAETILNGRDYSQVYWFLKVPRMERAGTDLLLAWVSALTRLNPVQIFMPVIVALFATLISATGAMLYQTKKWKNITLVSCFLLSCSPLSSLSVLCQLIAQVGGIPLFLTTCTLILQPFHIYQKYISLRQGILFSGVICALLIVYPELTPFLLLSIGLYFIISFLQGWRPNRSFMLTALLCIVLPVIALNTYWVNILFFVHLQVRVGLGFNDAGLFPYFFVPSGLSDLFGLQTIANPSKEPWTSLSILISSSLLILVASTTLLKIRNKLPIAIVMVVMSATTVILFVHSNGFGLFKISMYLQPVLISMLVISIFYFIKTKSKKIIFFTMFSLLTLYTQNNYVTYSMGGLGNPFVQLSDASQTKLLTEIKKLNKNESDNKLLVFDTSNIVIAKLFALYLSGKEAKFNSNNFFNIFRFWPDKTNFFLVHLQPKISKTANTLHDYISSKNYIFNFLINPKQSNVSTSFIKFYETPANNVDLVISTPLRTIFNRREFPELIPSNFIIRPLKDVSNHLIFVNSTLGQDYYLGIPKHISLYNLQKDYFYDQKGMAGLGSYLLFQVINPSHTVRFELNFTKTLMGDHTNQLPTPTAIGRTRIPFDIMGRGSARVFSSPIEPQVIMKNSYIMLDLGKGKKNAENPRSIIMKLFGKDVALDSRVLTCYARDVSIISEDEYKKLKPPSSLGKFPDDLDNPDLEYSGIYEDGWISENAYFYLLQPNNIDKLIVRGFLPPSANSPSSTKLQILVDDKQVFNQKINVGNFDIALNVIPNDKRRKVELHFDRLVYLPGDTKPLSAKIEFIGFTNPQPDLTKTDCFPEKYVWLSIIYHKVKPFLSYIKHHIV